MMPRNNDIEVQCLLDYVTEPYFIPEDTSLLSQLITFKKEKKRIGCVVDEYGDIKGILTLDDILEEIVGEYSNPTKRYKLQNISHNKIIVHGSIQLRDINKRLGINLSDSTVTTINGYILESLQEIPQAGMTFKQDNIIIEVEEVSNNFVERAIITNKMTKKKTSISNFESDLKKLQEILDDIESDKLTLEESIEKYKEGVEISKKCQKALDEAKQIIKVLDDENNSYQLLDRVNYPSDLKKLNDGELVDLATDIRAFILDVISKTGGHLAAGLEQLSYQYPFIIYSIRQKIKLFGMLVINVIHIRYLTGRKDKMLTIRKYKGYIWFFEN